MVRSGGQEHTSSPISESSCLLTSDGKNNRSPEECAASKLPGNADMISEAFMIVHYALIVSKL